MSSNTIPAALRKYLERSDMTMEELVDAADGIVAALAPRQTRYKVTERPDARTIRYYVTQGLLPKPLGYDGGRARYGGTHLLRLLVLKQLQAEHHTLTRIGSVLDGKTDEELLARIVTGEPEEVEAHAAAAAPLAAPRLALAPGGWVEAPAEVLSDPKKRAQLAESLEALAAWLRQTGDE